MIGDKVKEDGKGKVVVCLISKSSTLKKKMVTIYTYIYRYIYIYIHTYMWMHIVILCYFSHRMARHAIFCIELNFCMRRH